MKDKSPDTGPAVRFPPPLVFIGFVFLGLALDDLVGLPPIPMGPALGWAGTGLVGIGLALLIVSLGLFGASGENPEPSTGSKAIIARGPYRHSRNPMYLAMSAIHLGVAFAKYSPGTLLFLPIAMFAIDRFVILREEAYLCRKFGDAYIAYCSRVRRWI